jgi:CRISPR-associated protein Csb2
MGIVNSAPDPVLKPDSAGDIMIRVPHEGRLETLQKEYALQRRPSPSPEQPYTFAQAKKSLQAEATPFGEMIVFSKVEGQSIPIESLKAVSSVMRDTVLKLAPQSKLPVFHGHGDAPHLAYVPLPFVGHEHADGHIMGIGIVLPRGVDQQSRLAVMQTLAKLKTLRFRDFGVWELKLRRPGDPARTLDPQTWSAPSRAWTTVTPILLDKFPKKKLLPEAILLESCQRTGLPEPEEVVVHEISAFPGVPWARDFEQREKPNMAKRASTHATFIFPRPVEGPFLLGAGRFFGLGVLRPVGLKSSN